ncbi:hypothetical protein SDC9_68956 [bioreactor metagenome]|uniref:Nitroreductase domain-containing protein n=1 Tax=bioreactor metagenome TaxID=1076179 RepID=A0A644Y3K4_9ZZZZ
MNKFGQILRVILPVRIRKIGGKISRRIELKKLYRLDLNRFSKSAINLVSNMDAINLRSSITMGYHGIEKGFCKPKFRFGFGKNAIQSLGVYLLEYYNKGYNMQDQRVKTAIGVLEKYCEIHEGKSEYLNSVKSILDSIHVPKSAQNVGLKQYDREKIINSVKSDFQSLALNRMSVRDYGEEVVDKNLIEEALQIAMKTPSVCNRQTWMVHLITDSILLKRVLEIQGGFSGNGANLSNVILVTTNAKYFSGSIERNQGYIDGGIYLMSVVYALTYKGMATCILNAAFDYKREKEIRVLLGIDESELLIGFVTIGNYPGKFKCPVSVRDSYDEHLIIH